MEVLLGVSKRVKRELVILAGCWITMRMVTSGVTAASYSICILG